jgi:hypothetical protein
MGGGKYRPGEWIPEIAELYRGLDMFAAPPELQALLMRGRKPAPPVMVTTFPTQRPAAPAAPLHGFFFRTGPAPVAGKLGSGKSLLRWEYPGGDDRE